MNPLTEQDTRTLGAQLADWQAAFNEIKAKGLALNMTRGKPSQAQLDLANPMLEITAYTDDQGTDCRNYGVLEGLPATRTLFADFLGASPAEVLIGGNASLSLMHDTVVNALLHGVVGSDKPWTKEEKVKFLCPAPGYDRHFNVCQHLGIEMIPVRMTEEGPDVAQIASLVAEDAQIKGIWIVPRYSNPGGVVCSEAVVKALASMKTKATDFRILWDNAYNVHHLVANPTPLANILEACKAAGNPDRVFMYGSTSKISFAGGGISAMASSEANIAWMRKHRSMQTIGPDKLNQLRHLIFFKDMAGIEAHMQKHAEILVPKFEAVDRILGEELAGIQLATWSKPEGGYFVSLDTQEGLAQRVVALAAEAGVKMTAAGATFPYKQDPKNQNIRIAPSLPTLPEIEEAMRILALCIKIAAAEKA